LPVRCLCSDARGYGVLYKNAESDGLDALIVGEKLTTARVDAAYGACFAAIEQLTPVTLHQAGAPIGELQLFLGRRYTPHVNGAPCGGAAAGSKSTRGSAVRRSP
jgi:hypothetical protein